MRPSPSVVGLVVRDRAGARGRGGGLRGGCGTGHVNDEEALQPFQIRMVQRELSLRGLHVQPTGELDAPTRSALAEFQASKGLSRTGQLNWATARELGVDLDPRYNCEMNDSVDCLPEGGP